MSAPEFSRPVRIDTLGPAPRALRIEADSAERAALARRFGLLAVDRLAADLSLARSGGEVALEGTLSAAVTQACVATGAPLAAAIEARFALVFRPQPEAGAGDEIELGAGDLDVVFYDSPAVDVGEAAAETLLLNLDSYPRAPDADSALKAAGVKSEAEAGPFAALAALKDKLEP
jgi:uncharacterized metal-binding protein YceD (DUF177 family)